MARIWKLLALEAAAASPAKPESPKASKGLASWALSAVLPGHRGTLRRARFQRASVSGFSPPGGGWRCLQSGHRQLHWHVGERFLKD